MPSNPDVLICVGKDCRKRSETKKLIALAGKTSYVSQSKCLGICEGPVLVLEPTAAKPVVLSQLRTKKHRQDVQGILAAGSRLTPRLAKRTVTGSKKSKVLRRVAALA